MLSQCHAGHREAQTDFPSLREANEPSVYRGTPKALWVGFLHGPAHGTIRDLTVRWSPFKTKAVPQNRDNFPAVSQKKKVTRDHHFQLHLKPLGLKYDRNLLSFTVRSVD